MSTNSAPDWTASLALENIKRRSRTVQKQSYEDQQKDLEELKKMQGDNSDGWTI